MTFCSGSNRDPRSPMPPPRVRGAKVQNAYGFCRECGLRKARQPDGKIRRHI